MNRHQLSQHLRNNPGRSLRRIRLRGVNLSKLDFSGFDLTEADLSFSNISRSNFDGAILRGANLSFANLGGSSFLDADLREANLSYSGMAGVDLSRANIEGASLSFSGINRSAFQKKKPNSERLTLITLLTKPGWGLLIGSALGALLVYGASGIIYFTNLILTAKDPLIAQLNRFITIQNVAEGIALFETTWALSDWLDRRFRSIWLRHLILSFLLLPLFFVVSMSTYYALGKGVMDQMALYPSTYSDSVIQQPAPWYLYVLSSLLIGNIFLYALRQGRQVTRKMSEQEYKLLNMEKLKTRAELDALQARINPHFLYNALNSIASLVHEDADKAEEMTMLLSKLFRYTTGRDGSYFSTLAEELEMVRTYLRVEQVRFGDRLNFTVNVADVSLNELQLPQFLLHPIVENAVKHGISKRADSGLITVTIFERDGWLHLNVADNGPPFPDTMSGGYGLRSIQEKLTLLYGDDARVEFQNEPVKQVVILVRKSRLLHSRPPEPANDNGEPRTTNLELL